MAKQTFTTGQVLTAAQMTSLQQTAMLGGAASAKVASYTLVAADAGTAITMSNASATTITVNTSLFAAGDVVNITNIGAGVCTITAGTATVNTSASLALAQYESGTLEFISTSSAVFVKGASAAAGSGAAYSLLNPGGTALTGAGTITVSGISSQENILIIYENASSSNASANMTMRINSDTGANYAYGGIVTTTPASYSNTSNGFGDTAATSIPLGSMGSDTADRFFGSVQIAAAKSTSSKAFSVTSGGYSGNSPGGQQGRIAQGIYSGTSAVSSVSVILSTGNFDAGYIYVYTSAN
jgi:hypothetical protein